MANLKATFRGLYTDVYPNSLPSGVADDILNTVFEGTSLKGRKGFDLWEESTGSAILNLCHVTFANGNGYIVKKLADGYLYYQVDTGGAWTKIAAYSGTSDDAIRNTSDPGWFYFWSDRLYYFDRSGSVKWHPVDGIWKAGIDSTVGPATLTPAAGGEKEGYYHVHVAKWNSSSEELSRVTAPQTPGCTTRVSENFGGIAILPNPLGELDLILAADLNYEWDRIVAFITKGDTEYTGLGNGAEKFSYVARWDADVASDAVSLGLNKADSVLQKEQAFTNAGGLPPASRHGFYSGSRAIYLDTYTAGGAAEPGNINFSVPRFPTMVPQKRLYTVGGDSKTFVPKPWEGELRSIIKGSVRGVGSVGERFVVFTSDGVFWLLPLSDGRLYPVAASEVMGAVSETGVVSTLRGVHGLSRNAWLRATERGLENIAHNRFKTTLETLPADLSGVVAGAYTFRNEIWMAVPNASGYVQKILIWDEARNEIVSIWDIAGIGTSSITSFVEVPSSSGPIMLAGLDDGRILKWPGAAYTDPGSTAYACHWRGYFGQERRMYDQHLLRVILHISDNTDSTNGITVEAAGLRTPAELGNSVTMESIVIKKENLAAPVGAEFDKNTDGNLFVVKISSTTDQGADWSVDDMVLELDRLTK